LLLVGGAQGRSQRDRALFQNVRIASQRRHLFGQVQVDARREVLLTGLLGEEVVDLRFGVADWASRRDPSGFLASESECDGANEGAQQSSMAFFQGHGSTLRGLAQGASLC
jgi:hypothetical protein